MKKKHFKTLVLIGMVIVGYMIVVNFDVKGSESANNITVSEYQKALEEKNKLIQQISTLMDENEELEERISKYSYTKGDEEVVSDMKSLLNIYGLVTGLNEVKGPGVVIKINDGKYTSDESTYEKRSKILHDNDVECLLNDIKYAGAEAISINDHRIVYNTGVACRWAFIGFEDGDQAYATFNFYCIGDPDTLEAELTKDGGYLNKLITRGLDVTIEKKEEIVLKAGYLANYSNLNEYTGK